MGDADGNQSQTVKRSCDAQAAVATGEPRGESPRGRNHRGGVACGPPDAGVNGRAENQRQPEGQHPQHEGREQRAGSDERGALPEQTQAGEHRHEVRPEIAEGDAQGKLPRFPDHVGVKWPCTMPRTPMAIMVEAKMT